MNQNNNNEEAPPMDAVVKMVPATTQRRPIGMAALVAYNNHLTSSKEAIMLDG